MLVLSRKVSEEIKIGDDIVVSVVKVKGNVARIGITAPDGVMILRAELNERPSFVSPVIKMMESEGT